MARRVFVGVVLVVALAGCGGGASSSEDQAATEATEAPATTSAVTVPATTPRPASTSAPLPTSPPLNLRAVRQELAGDRRVTKVRATPENGVQVSTNLIFTYDNTTAAVEMCNAVKAAAPEAFVEVMGNDGRWLARTTAFTGRCKATTLIR
jgi:hypothetical protein